MKTQLNQLRLPLLVLVLLAGLHQANAFYDPSAQRWLNRDPLEERGFETLRNILPIPIRNLLTQKNLYAFLDNRAGNAIDPFGLIDCGALLRRAASLYEKAEQGGWNSAILEAQADKLITIWYRYCPPPPPPPSPQPKPFCPIIIRGHNWNPNPYENNRDNPEPPSIWVLIGDGLEEALEIIVVIGAPAGI
jgi:hypothetical protein